MKYNHYWRQRGLKWDKDGRVSDKIEGFLGTVRWLPNLKVWGAITPLRVMGTFPTAEAAIRVLVNNSFQLAPRRTSNA
jgi:hypothetical protein